MSHGVRNTCMSSWLSVISMPFYIKYGSMHLSVFMSCDFYSSLSVFQSFRILGFKVKDFGFRSWDLKI